MRRELKLWIKRISECRNPYLLATAARHEWRRKSLLKFATGLSMQQLLDYVREIEDDDTFLDEVRLSLSKWTYYQPRAIDFVLLGRWGSVFFNEVTLYAIVRARRPKIMIETGGTPGKSTAFILRAMEKNKAGHLFTIDWPPQEVASERLEQRDKFHHQMPRGKNSNWVVPEYLRKRQTLLLGKSKELLPALLETTANIDMFLHDSDHSYENMMWEFETVWPKLRANGLLLSDDVLDNRSFFEFCLRKGLQSTSVFNLGVALAGNN